MNHNEKEYPKSHMYSHVHKDAFPNNMINSSCRNDVKKNMLDMGT